ncbi:6689_t:CDS:2 [Funneliformis geosporum]|uniref:6689_t:CDS:1 n=1 Tax=Funneliformis geosporum TaxID=1117311 RepID=A0A9W4SVU8_9GLOM|nr:6689_t:CDS:2 [Funneliformis geosporum]
MVNAQEWLDKEYPINGTCQRISDSENRGKKRADITTLDISKGKVGHSAGNLLFGDKVLTSSLKLEGFTNLRVLIISSHQLISLDTSDCPNLEALDCQNNQLNILNINNCSSLEKINCSGNYIKKLGLNTNIELKEINCDFNKNLKETDVSNCPNLIKTGSGFAIENGKLIKNVSQITPAGENSIRNILIIGITGSGKSALANVLSSTNQFGESNYSTSATKSFQSSGVVEYQGKKYRVIDNIGFGDTNKITEEEILFRIGEGIHEAKEGLNQILFVFKDRFSQEHITVFNMFKDFIDEIEIAKFTTIVRTRFPKFKKKEACEKDKQTLISQTIELSEIINSCNGLIHVDNPSVDEDDSDDEAVIDRKRRGESREMVLKYLTENYNINSMVEDYKQRVEKGSDSEAELKIEKNKMVQGVKRELEANIRIDTPLGFGFANVVTNTNDFKESSGSASETKKVQLGNFKEDNLNYQIVDTPGIGDTKMSNNEVLDIIAEAVYRARKGVGQVFFVINGRFEQYEMATYDLLRTVIFDKEITKHTTIVRTCFKNFKKEKKYQVDIDSMVKEANEKRTELRQVMSAKEKELTNLSSAEVRHQELSTELEQLKKELVTTNLAEILESCQERIVYVDNPPLDDEEKLEINKKKRIESRKILLEHLSKSYQEAPYIPDKLKELSKEIESDYSDYLKKKEELNEELKRLNFRTKASISQTSPSQTSKISLPSDQTELTSEENPTPIEEKIIRQKVLKHIFNNYEGISKELGGNIFLNSVADKKQLTVEIVKRASYPQNIERLRNEYVNYLQKETELLAKHSQQLPPEANSLQEYLDNKYPTTEEKAQVKEIIINQNNPQNELDGQTLNLTNYPNLETIKIHGRYLKSPLTKLELNNNPKLIELDCRSNQLTSLNINNCPNLKKIFCFNNQLTNLNFLHNLNEEKLTELSVRNNKITSDLIPLNKFINLEGLYLDNNNFFGSLQSLRGLDKLNNLSIDDTDIDSAEQRKDAKCKDIYNLLANNQGKVETNYDGIINFPQKLQAYKQKLQNQQTPQILQPPKNS